MSNRCHCAAAVLATGIMLVAPTNRPAIADAADNVVAEFDVASGGDLIILPIWSGARCYQFVLDTGSTCSSFNERHRGTLGERFDIVRGGVPGGPRSFERFAAPKITLAGRCLRTDAYVTILDLAFVEDNLGGPIDGILGMDVLRHLVVTIDFDAGKVRILKSAAGCRGRATSIIWHERLRVREGPFIAARIDGRLVCEFLLDTAATTHVFGTIDSKLFDSLVLSDSLSPLHAQYAMISAGKTSRETAARLRSAEVAGYKHMNVNVTRRQFFHTLGLGFFSRYVVTLDFPNSVAYLSPGRDWARPDLTEQSGIFVSRNNGDIVVRQIRAGSAGGVAGVQPGDVVLGVDGREVISWSLYRIWRTFAIPGRHLLLLRRNGKKHLIEFTSPDHDNDNGSAREKGFAPSKLGEGG